jgi:cytochrome P450
MSQFYRDPYPFYARWRNENPIHFDERLGAWFMTTYADAVAVLRDARFRAIQPTRRPGRDEQSVQRLFDVAYRWVLYQNPPDHARVRKLVNQVLALDFLSGLGPLIQAVVAPILDECAERGSFDLIDDVAAPAAVLVLAEAMGLPGRDSHRFRRWSHDIGRFIDGSLRPTSVDAAAQAVGEAVEYLGPIIESRRAVPGRDLISRLAASHDHVAESSEADLLATCVLLLATGQETTVALFGNGVAALVEHPGELQRLRRDRTLGVLAVEEFLRFDSPVQVVTRVLDRDVEWSGKRLARRSQVNIFIGSANRDPAQFPDPDRLDVGRTKNAHIAFGAGIHVCPGAGMARLVTRIAIEELLRRFPTLTPGPAEPVRRPGGLLRCFQSIPVQV